MANIDDYFENITLTEDELNLGYFKSKWYKLFESEDEYLANNKNIVKIRDGVYKYQSESDLLQIIEQLKKRLDELDGGE